MKEKYLKPELEIEEFNTVNIITTSDDNFEPFPTNYSTDLFA